MPPSLLVLVPSDAPAGAAPEQRPLGRAALALEDEGVCVLFGDQVEGAGAQGWRARPGRWVPADSGAIDAVHDRYPSEGRRGEWLQLRAELAGIPMGNPGALTLLCKDKLLLQRLLEEGGIELPEVEGSPERFDDCLDAWGAAFLKPRRGSLGEGVQRVAAGQRLPPCPAGDWVLQRAVSPPPGLAGLTLRILAQRESSSDWWLGPIVARRSTTDPVVNAARGADVLPASEAVSEAAQAEVRERTRAVARCLAAQEQGELLVELGLDFVVDAGGRPHLIEVNSCPRGRLLFLARQDSERYGALHQQACERPLRRLLQLATEGTA